MMPATDLMYITHAVGRDPIQRGKNILSVQRWFKFLIDFGPMEWAYTIPWLPYVQNLDEETYRERGIRDGQIATKTCSGIILVGGDRTSKSAGAKAERALFAHQPFKTIYDLTAWNEHPPFWIEDDAFYSIDKQPKVDFDEKLSVWVAEFDYSVSQAPNMVEACRLAVQPIMAEQIRAASASE